MFLLKKRQIGGLVKGTSTKLWIFAFRKFFTLIPRTKALCKFGCAIVRLSAFEFRYITTPTNFGTKLFPIMFGIYHKICTTLNTLFMTNSLMTKVRWFSSKGIKRLRTMILKIMNTRAFKKFQIFQSIVSDITVLMMNDLGFIYQSFEVFFHYKTMFGNISLFTRIWMRRFKNVFVSRTQDVWFSNHNVIIPLLRGNVK